MTNMINRYPFHRTLGPPRHRAGQVQEGGEGLQEGGQAAKVDITGEMSDYTTLEDTNDYNGH